MNPTETTGSGFLRARRILSFAPGVEGDAIWWRDGRIEAVGTAAELARRVPAATPVYDLPDTLVTPGFVDGHTHFAMWALSRRRVQLAGAGTRDEAVRRVAAAAPVQGWVIGQGWDANGWDRAPDRAALDAVQPGAGLSRLARRARGLGQQRRAGRAGISRTTPDPYGGRIVRDGAGEPTGLLLERAVELMVPHLPEPPADRARRARCSRRRRKPTGWASPASTTSRAPRALAAFGRLEPRRSRSGCGCCFIRRSRRSPTLSAAGSGAAQAPPGFASEA